MLKPPKSGLVDAGVPHLKPDDNAGKPENIYLRQARPPFFPQRGYFFREKDKRIDPPPGMTISNSASPPHHVLSYLYVLRNDITQTEIPVRRKER